MENSNNYYTWLSNFANLNSFSLANSFKTFFPFTLQFWELRDYICCFKMEIFSWSGPRGYSGFLRPFCDYFLGSIALLARKAFFSPQITADPTAGSEVACDFYASHIRSLGTSSLGLVLCHSGLRFLLNFCLTILSIYAFGFAFTNSAL